MHQYLVPAIMCKHSRALPNPILSWCDAGCCCRHSSCCSGCCCCCCSCRRCCCCCCPCCIRRTLDSTYCRRQPAPRCRHRLCAWGTRKRQRDPVRQDQGHVRRRRPPVCRRPAEGRGRQRERGREEVRRFDEGGQVGSNARK